MTSKIIFCAHGVTSPDKMIEIQFEFAEMKFYCDAGFRLMQPSILSHDPSNPKLLKPYLLIETIATNKLIPRRIKSGEWIYIQSMDTEINKLKYVADPTTGKIKLNDMLFSVSVTDRHKGIFRENFGIYFCKPDGEIRKLMGIDDLFDFISRKAKLLRQPVTTTRLNYRDVFMLLRDLIATKIGPDDNFNPEKTEICMFTCRGFDADQDPPGQQPITIN